MLKQEAVDFFSEIFGGEHHINAKIEEFGHGFAIKKKGLNMATFDNNQLTRLVLLAHEKAIRVDVSAVGFQYLQIAIWKRKREGSLSERHPTIHQALSVGGGF